MAFPYSLENSMALDIYLQIDGIKGESTDEGHLGWIELTGAHWGVTQPISASASTAGGHSTGSCEHRILALSKEVDLASPLLMQHCAMGKTIPKARLEFMRADGNSKRIKYYEVELENIMIANMDQMLHDSGLLHDDIGLRFGKIKWKYTQQMIGGGVGGNTVGGWDLNGNKCHA
jgi:type VI secretion system secreted protein Hcp